MSGLVFSKRSRGHVRLRLWCGMSSRLGVRLRVVLANNRLNVLDTKVHE
jgi:hypothetical protein